MSRIHTVHHRDVAGNRTRTPLQDALASLGSFPYDAAIFPDGRILWSDGEFWPASLPPVSPTVDEALEHVREYAAEQLAEAKAEYRAHAKQTWRDLGMKRPLDAQDRAETVAALSKATAAAGDAIRQVAAAYVKAVKPALRRLLDDPAVQAFIAQHEADRGDTTTEGNHP